MKTALEEEKQTITQIYIPKRKRLLLTGGCGFVGHHIVEGVLKQTDWEIIILDALTYAGNLNRLTDISIWDKEKHRVKFIWHDLKAPISETTHKMIGDLDYIWHLAAESHVGRSLEDAVPFAMSNVVGTTHLLEHIKHRQPNLKMYIGFNTDEVFGSAEIGEYHLETDKFYPSNPYSAAKAAQWCMEYAFAHSFGLPICMVHSMNIFAERQHTEKFIPMVVKRILNNEKVIIHGIPGHISQRHWIHAREICNGLLFLTEKGEPKESYNIIGEEKDALWIANKICQVIKDRDLKEDEIEYFDFHALRPGHDFRYALDGSKLRNLGWQPKLNLDESLEKTIKWMIKIENRKWLNL